VEVRQDGIEELEICCRPAEYATHPNFNRLNEVDVREAEVLIIAED
jgi:hypothetical protein